MWIEALDFSIEVGEKMMLHEMVGQDFKGNKYAYLDHSFEKIELISNGKKQTINPRLGDLPAIQYKSKESALHIITAETTPSQGLPFEWVALTNPYESSKQVTLQLFWQGKPAINMNVHVFNRTRKGNKSIKKHLRTDQNGQVMIPKAEGGLFLINSVKMIPINNKLQNETDAVWESIWASLTYAVE